MAEKNLVPLVSQRDLLHVRHVARFLWDFPKVLMLIGLGLFWRWPNVSGALWTIGFFWMGASCVANSIICRRAHCVFTGPLYLLLGLTGAGILMNRIPVSWVYVWVAYGIGRLLAHIPEWRGKVYFEKTPS